jgi:hypothetical protein
MCLKKDQEAEHYKKLWQMQTQRYDFCLSYFNEDKAQEITNKSLRNLKEEQKHETD